MGTHDDDLREDDGAPLWREALVGAVYRLAQRAEGPLERLLEAARDVVEELTEPTGEYAGREPGRRVSDAQAATFIVVVLLLAPIVLGVLLALVAGVFALVDAVRSSSVWIAVSGWHSITDGVDWLAGGPAAPVTAYLSAHSQGLPWSGPDLLLGWAVAGLALWALATSTVRAGQLAWPLYVGATAVMAYQGTSGSSAPVVAGLVSVTGLVLAVPALRRGRDRVRVVEARSVFAPLAPPPAFAPIDPLDPPRRRVVTEEVPDTTPDTETDTGADTGPVVRLVPEHDNVVPIDGR